MTILSLLLCLLMTTASSALAADLNSQESIREIQILLSLKGLYEEGQIDGINGPLTKTAIALYEQEHGWPRTGHITSRLAEQLRMEAKSALINGSFPGSKVKNNGEKERTGSDTNEYEALSRDLNHTQAHLTVTALAVERIQNSIVDHFSTLGSSLRTEGLAWMAIIVTLVVSIAGAVIGFLGRRELKRRRKEHRKMIELSKADASTQIFCVLGGHCLDLYQHLNPITDTRYPGYLYMGVNLSTIAYRNAMYLRDNYSKLHEQPLPEGKIKTINTCINNYVFYLGSRATEKDKGDALSALQELSEITEKYERENTQNWWSYKETLLYAKLNFGWEKPLDIQRELQTIFNNMRVPIAWTIKTKERYDQHYNTMRLKASLESIDLTIRGQ